MTLKSFMENNRLSALDVAKKIGVDKSQIIKICTRSYPNWEQKEADIIEKLKSLGYSENTSHFTIDTKILVMTKSVSDFASLADDLSDPDGSLSSSIGMAIGVAERGKTHAAKWYAQSNPHATYVLYIDGSTKVQLLRDICEAIAHTRPHSFGACLQCIEESCKYTRKLVIIDEADKLPVTHLEMIRGINERANLPFLLVGEDGLKQKTDRITRLRSRIRQPIVLFEPVRSVDVAAYYQEAAGLTIPREIAERLIKHARGGFRSVVNDSIALAKIARISSLDDITPNMLDAISA